jgi:hypothetical protein
MFKKLGASLHHELDAHHAQPDAHHAQQGHRDVTPDAGASPAVDASASAPAPVPVAADATAPIADAAPVTAPAAAPHHGLKDSGLQLLHHLQAHDMAAAKADATSLGGEVKGNEELMADLKIAGEHAKSKDTAALKADAAALQKFL